SPDGGSLYIVVQSGDTSLGDGILVINTKALEASAFIPLSGAVFPPDPARPQPPAVTLDSVRPGLAISKDGRLLYVAAGDRIIIVNTEKPIAVRKFLDMPRAYRARASLLSGVLENRLNQAAQAAVDFTASIA